MVLRQSAWTFAAALLPLCLMTLAGSGVHPASQSRRITPRASRLLPLQVVFSGEANGYLAPCGCSNPMLGGFPRRGALLRSMAQQASLVNVENGDLTHALGRQDELKAETLVEMFNQLDYTAINAGEQDFQLGVPYLQALRQRFKGALLSANARKADGTPLLDEMKVVRRMSSGRLVNVVITGLLSEQFFDGVRALNPEVRFETPAAALERLKPALLSAGDVRILLYHGPMAEAEELAQRFPLFALVVCAHEGDHPVDIKRAGTQTLACSGQDGKYVGNAKISPRITGTVEDAGYKVLGPELEDEKEILQTKRSYLDRVAAEDLMGKLPRVPLENGDSYAGSTSCGACHAVAYRRWQASGHSGAFDTLARVNEHRDPECVACHVVGLDRQSGFVSPEKTPALKEVGCESCHGAGAKHVLHPELAPMAKVGSSSCISCHNPQNSPGFDFSKYWLRIRH